MTHRQRTKSQPRSRRAFSLVELIVVVVIIGILGAMAVPRLANSIAIHRVDAAARRIAADLALARRQAKNANTPQTVRFVPAADRYALVGLPDRDDPIRDYAVSLREEPYVAGIVSADFGGDSDIIFDIYGVPDSTGSVVVQVGTQVRTITVDPDTGSAGIQ